MMQRELGLDHLHAAPRLDEPLDLCMTLRTWNPSAPVAATAIAVRCHRS